MSALPILPPRAGRELPDYLPARMVNEFVYCPRLFFYEWVEGLFRHSADTVEGGILHARVDKRATQMPGPEEAEAADKVHSRSVMLSSERLRVIAKLDLAEVEGGLVTPVDYKHGKPKTQDDGLELWPADRVQLAVQALVLRENGYRCDEGVAYYAKTKQRVRVAFTEALMRETEEAISAAWDLALHGEIPAPLVDSPKCPGCSLVSICLPDETWSLRRDGSEPEQMSLFEDVPRRKGPRPEVRQMMTARDELKPVYLNTPGLRVGKSGDVLQVKERDAVKQEIRMGEICQLNLMGNIQITTQAVQSLCEAEIPVSYFSQGGWFYGITTGLNTKNVFLRRAQFRLAEQDWFARGLARRLVAGKIRNQRTMLQRNHIEPQLVWLNEMKRMADAAGSAASLEELLGIEGYAARVYFGAFAGMIKTRDDGFDGEKEPEFSFDFAGRNRRPPRDAVNALLSLAYSLLAKDMMLACYAVGFDPLMGFYHQPRFGRAALALDLMEPFRPLIADSAVLSAINMRMVTPKDFVQVGPAVAMAPSGRKGFFRAYEARMDTLVTHPLFDYRVTYRRMLEIQARLLARTIEGEIGSYPVFVTR